MARRALITGIFGQDGAYLAKLLLDKGYEVYGGHRQGSSPGFWRLEKLGVSGDVQLVNLDLLELSNILRVIDRIHPDEVYNLAAQSFVGASFEQPVVTSDINALGVARLLEALRTLSSEARFYQASTSEMFGKVRENPQNENTPLYPRSPYAAAKVYAHYLTINYRESYDMHLSCGILFNHESPLRGEEFVTRKITRGFARVTAGLQERVELGNLDSSRDWGFAGDYVHGIWLMLQQENPDTYVLATGEKHSVREFCELAAAALGIDLRWEGEGAATRGIDSKRGRDLVYVNERFFRPAEVEILCGDASKAKKKLGWQPTISFAQLVEMMVRADVEACGITR